MLTTLPPLFKRGSKRLQRFVITKERRSFERQQKACNGSCGRVSNWGEWDTPNCP